MEEEKLRLRFNELDDMAVTTASAFLGLTLGCARCHDHKYDAIPTRDYYRLQCAFSTTTRQEAQLVSRAEAAAYRKEGTRWSERLKEVSEPLKSWLSEQKKPLEPALRKAKIAALPTSDESKRILLARPGSDAAKKLARQHAKALNITDDDYRRAFTDD